MIFILNQSISMKSISKIFKPTNLRYFSNINNSTNLTELQIKLTEAKVENIKLEAQVVKLAKEKENLEYRINRLKQELNSAINEVNRTRHSVLGK